ncbi:MAG: hypothetical protein IJV16_00700 [Lachnospiraceae bacterium]|nr:hypothetical protein [Lachnospiraceae bacterium]MBR1524320.1 hypothetical protein [Lachnospiraceae bacterium]
MKIIDRRKSLEACTEAGWDAFDLLTDEPLSDEDIESLRQVEGSFLYLKQLKKPFFKIENHNYIIKGVKGDPFFRFAVHRDHVGEIEKLVKALS